MKTDDLIGLLSNQVTRIERGAVARRFTKALLLGALGSLILMSVVFGVRHDLGSVARTTIFWAKMAYPLAIAVGAMLLLISATIASWELLTKVAEDKFRAEK